MILKGSMDTMGYEAKTKAYKFNPNSNIAATPKQNNTKESMANISIPDAIRDNYVASNSSKFLSINDTSFRVQGMNRFPFDLSPKRAMTIKVYDTKSNDFVNKALESGSKWVENKINAFFSDSGGSSTQTSQASAQAKQTNAVNAKGNNSSSNPLGVFGGVWPELPPDFGNPRLAKELVDTFYLPIPNNISESLSNNYADQSGWINDVGSAIGSIAGGEVKALKAAQGILATYSKFTGTRAIKSYENSLQMFNSQNFREITLSWDLVPNNSAESNALQDLVTKIKAYGSPESMAGKLLVKAPHFFGLRFNNQVLDNALRFNEVVLIAASIEYVPGGNMELYEDGQPKHIQLNMTFKDRMPKLMRDWLSPMPGDGEPAPEPKCG